MTATETMPLSSAYITHLNFGALKMSINTKEIFAALGKAQAAYDAVAKSNDVSMTNKEGRQGAKYKYAELGDVQAALKQPFAENGLSYTQWLLPDGIATMISHASGQWICGTLEGAKIQMRGSGPQDYGSFTTYLRRYHLAAATGIAQEDDDGSKAQQSGSGGGANPKTGNQGSPANKGKPSSSRQAPGKPGNEQPPPKAPAKPPAIDKEIMVMLFDVAKKAKWVRDDVFAVAKHAYGYTSCSQITWPQANIIAPLIEKGLSPVEVVERILNEQ